MLIKTKSLNSPLNYKNKNINININLNINIIIIKVQFYNKEVYLVLDNCKKKFKNN
jgi:hypothetical protein